MERSKNSSLALSFLSSAFSLFVFICIYVYLSRYLGFFAIVRGGKTTQVQQKSKGDNCRKALKLHKPFIPLVLPVMYLINLPV